MRIIYNNQALAGRYTTLLSSSSAGGNPATNALHPFRSYLWTTGTSTANEYIELQFPAAVSIGAIALFDHSFVNGADTLRIKANSSSSWGSPPHNVALTIASQISAVWTPASYQYWRLELTKASAGVARTLGVLMLGSYYDTPYAPDYDGGYSEELIDPSRPVKSISGQTFTEDLPKYRKFKTEFSFNTQATKDALTTIFNSIGVGGQCAFQVENSGGLTELIYGRMTKLSPFKVSGWDDTNHRWDVGMEFEEQV